MRAFPRVLAIGLTPALALAQTSASVSAHSVKGIVFDSLAHKPLSGAVVQAVAVDSASASPRELTFSAVTDAAGRYQLTGMPNGRFAIGLQHDALNALGISSPIRGLELGGDSIATMDLAIPSGSSVRAMACGAGDGSHEGMLAGYVLDAQRGATIPGAEVLVQWVELDLKRGKLQSTPHHVTATIADDGAYKACAIPADGPVVVRVSSKNLRTVETELSLPAGGVERRDFRLADANAVRGSGSVVMRVVDDSGALVPSGRVGVSELGRDVPIEDGVALVGDLPLGTWVMTLRSLGFQPRLVLVDATIQHTTDTVVMDRNSLTLDTVRVVAGKPGKDSLVIRNIQQRLLVANGTLIRSDNLSVVNGSYASDAIRAAAGFVMKSPTHVEGRVYTSGKGFAAKPCTSAPHYPGSSEKVVAVYLDGNRVPGGLEDVNNMVPVKDILAVEAYPDVISAPFLWRTNDACAVVAFWTKH